MKVDNAKLIKLPVQKNFLGGPAWTVCLSGRRPK